MAAKKKNADSPGDQRARATMRFVVGTGGFIGEATLERDSNDNDDLRKAAFEFTLTNVFVHPLRRNRGWGHQLMRTVCAFADHNGFQLRLIVMPHGVGEHLDRAALEAFYAGYGFVRTTHRVLTVERRDSPVEMVREWSKVK